MGDGLRECRPCLRGRRRAALGHRRRRQRQRPALARGAALPGRVRRPPPAGLLAARFAAVLALGILAAIAASVLYNTAIALQALEARRVPTEHSLRPSLLGRLLRSRRWLGATAIGLLGWPLEIAAL